MAASIARLLIFGYTKRKCFPLIFVPIRHKAKVNIKKPAPPHFRRACVLEVTKPIYKPILFDGAVKCGQKLKEINGVKEDHPIEVILARDVKKLFFDHKFIVICHSNSLSLQDVFEIKRKFFRKDMAFRQYSKRVVELALQDTPYINIVQILQGFHMDSFIFAKTSDVGIFLKIQKKIPQIIPLAAILENRFLSIAELIEYNKLPSLDVMRGHLCGTLNAGCQRLVQNLNHHQTRLSSLLTQYIKDKS